jgi:hypothetical protein
VPLGASEAELLTQAAGINNKDWYTRKHTHTHTHTHRHTHADTHTRRQTHAHTHTHTHTHTHRLVVPVAERSTVTAKDVIGVTPTAELLGKVTILE